VTDYEVEIDGDSVWLPVYGTTYLHDNLNKNEAHTYKVKTNKFGDWSGVSAITDAFPAPHVVVNDVTENSIEIKWNAIGGEAYQVKVDGNSPIPVGVIDSYRDLSLTSNTIYKYKVRIVGQNQWSNEVSPYTLTEVVPPVVPPVTPPAVTPPPVVIPPVVIPLPVIPPEKVNVLRNSSSYRRHNSARYDLEFSIIDEKTLSYKENLSEDTEENKLRRMILYTFWNKYYLNINIYRNDESVLNTQFEINLNPGQLFTDNEIRNISIDKKDTIDTILVQDTSESSGTKNFQEKDDLSEYSIADKYIFTIGKPGTQLEREQKYIKSKE
jgi:hypothetical protein